MACSVGASGDACSPQAAWAALHRAERHQSVLRGLTRLQLSVDKAFQGFYLGAESDHFFLQR